MAVVHPECEMKPSFGGHLEGGVFRGDQGVRRWFSEVVPETWSELTAEPQDSSRRVTTSWSSYATSARDALAVFASTVAPFTSPSSTAC